MKRRSSGGHFDIEGLTRRRLELENVSARPDFWTDSRKAKDVLKELESTKMQLDAFFALDGAVSDCDVLLEFFALDPSEAHETELNQALEKAKASLKDLQLKKMLAGELDANPAFMLINAGAGGTESCDWVAILMRMYMRYGEKRGDTVEIVDYTEGDGAGYRSVTLRFAGAYAYGYLKAENGVHRLVRISPFDANKRRHTSFASVFVYAEVDDDIEIDLREEDIKMDTYRAGGAGGQKVNKTDSAVRLTHIPTGLIAACQTERSQHQNRATAMKMLKAQLYELEMKKRQAEKEKIEANKEEIGWGSQIRSYVLHPYQMVKDHRTNFESTDTQGVLDGEINDFIKEYLVR